MKRSTLPFIVTATLLGWLTLLFPLLHHLAEGYHRELNISLRSESMTYLRTLSEYLYSRLAQYELLMNSTPALKNVHSFMHLLNQDASRIQEVQNAVLLDRKGKILTSLLPVGEAERKLNFDLLSLPYSIQQTETGPVLLLSKQFAPQSLTEPSRVVVFLNNLHLLPDHSQFSYPIQWIALADVHGNYMYLWRHLLADTSPTVLEEKRGTGLEFEEQVLFGWDQVRGFPLRVWVSFNVGGLQETIAMCTARVFVAGYGLALVIYLFGFLIVRYNWKSRAQAQELKMRDMVLRETHHRIKNNIQAITSLLNLQNDLITDPEMKRTFTNTIGRLRVIVFLHEELYKQESLRMVQLGQYAGSILKNIETLYGTKERGITIQTELDSEISVDMKLAQACGFILHEAVCNSIMHAFPNGKIGSIGVKVEKRDHSIFLSIQDNGVGNPSGLGETSGLGMVILESMATTLRGSITIDRSIGTKVQVQFPG